MSGYEKHHTLTKKHHNQTLGIYPKINGAKHRNINKDAYEIPSEEMKVTKLPLLAGSCPKLPSSGGWGGLDDLSRFLVACGFVF